MTLEIPNDLASRTDSASRTGDTRFDLSKPAPAPRGRSTTPGLLALGASQDAAPVSTVPALQTSQAVEAPEVKEARENVRLAEGRLIAAQKTPGVPDASLKKFSFELASSKLALAKAKNEPDDRIELLSDQRVIAKVLWASSATTAKDKTVAYIRGNHLFMNNDEVDYIRKLSLADQVKLIRQCGGHVEVMNIKSGEIVNRKSPPAMYFEFYKNYPAQRIQQKDLDRIQRNGPQVIPATPENLEKLRRIKKEVDTTITYESDEAHWTKFQQWNEGEDGRGDCEDFAAKAQRLCLEAGIPHEAALLTFVIDHTNV
jgi:predicted transglutaminase-like cysteine proteinase